MQFSNPFDNPQGQFYILRNDQQQYSLWPAHCDLPAGWTVACPPQSARKKHETTVIASGVHFVGNI
ncbi:MbtH family protein, partial [Klebsiella pneumoniae]